MKLKTLLIAAFIFIFSVSFMTSCSENTPPETCTVHVDTDKNGKCDECGTDVEIPNEPPSVCEDSDGDGLCDECGEAVASEPEEEPEPTPECEHKDKNYDGRCDACKEKMENALLLVDKGKTDFSIVVPWGIGGESLMAIDRFASELGNLGVDIEVVNDSKDTETEFEILFGDVESRADEYKIDGHIYGKKGYAIEITDKKIVVQGGSENSLILAIEELRTRIFGITEKTVRLINRAVYPEQSFEVVQDDYKVTSLSLYGEDLRSYTIAIDEKDAQSFEAANALRELLYEKIGYWLPIVDSEGEAKAIHLLKAQKSDGEGFYVSFAEGRIEIKSEYYPSLSKETCAFFASVLDYGEGEVDLTAEKNFIKDVRYVYYDDFGAVGDGVTNDVEAISAAHVYANSGGYEKVVATAGKTYYIGDAQSEIPVATSVDWTGAKFIIDDTVSKYLGIVFHVISADTSRSFTAANSEVIRDINEAGGIDSESFTRLDLGLGYPAMLKINDSTHRQYVRYGPNASGGIIKSDMILVDAEGNIDPTTPILFDFDTITSIGAYRTDLSPLTITGGEFTTIANTRAINSTYSNRGIYVSRSNVTVNGLKHYIVGEGDVGAAYSFFLGIGTASDITVADSVFSGHKTYYLPNGVGIGSYDLNIDKSVNVTFKNCTQANFFNENGSVNTKIWGVMASGECKNLTYDGCALSRFDAHEGVVNATIKNSTVGAITVVGGGNLIIENSHIYRDTVVELRSDYGSFWKGEVLIKDVTVHSSLNVKIFEGNWYNHDFGYETFMPRSLTVDNLTVVDAGKISVLSSKFEKSLNKAVEDEFVSINGETGEEKITLNVNKTLPMESITVKNLPGTVELVLPTGAFFKDTVITAE